MSRAVGNAFYKIMIVVIALAVIVGLREQLLTNKAFGALFGQLMGELPFAKLIADVVTKTLGFNYVPPELTLKSVTGEILKLALMAWLQPLVVGLLTSIFLPLPPRNQILATSLLPWSDRAEEYMETPGYRFKALLIKIVAMVPLALLSGWLLGKLQDALITYLGNVGASIVMLGLLILLVVLSLGHLVRGPRGISVGRAAAWRGFDLTMGILDTFVTEALCLVIFLGLLNGTGSGVGGSIVGFIVVLILLDMAKTLIQRAIVS